MGLDISRRSVPVESDLDLFFKFWKEAAPAPVFVIDVGANLGDWTRKAFGYFPDSHFLMIEPQDYLRAQSEDLLRHPKISWRSAGASDSSGHLMLTITSESYTCTFAMSAEEAASSGYEQRRIPVVTLNEIVKTEKHFQYPRR